MCYKKPGPRCTRHTRRRFGKARKAYNANPNDETYARMVEAREEYLSSPEGIRKLKAQYAKSKNEADNDRYQHYKLIRENQMAAYKESLKPTVKSVPEPIKGTVDGKASIAQALESSLSYDGPQPQWWADYEKKSREEAGHPVIADGKREILDVIDSTEGKIAVVWEEHSTAANDKYSIADKGYQVQRLAYFSFDTGATLGYIKATNQSPESFKVAFGDDEYSAFRYDSANSGSSYYHAETLEESGNANPDELARAYWLDSTRAAKTPVTTESGEYVPSYNLSEEHIPKDMNKVKADLKERAAAIAPKMKASLDFNEQPYVDFSRMNDPLKGKGFGTSAYVYTARKLAQQGKCLKASGIQSESALPLWERLQKNFPDKVKPIELSMPSDSKRKETYLTFDFRGESLL